MSRRVRWPVMADPLECTFCRIVEGAADAEIVAADADVVVFLDHRPLFPGHCLVVPRRHVATLPELPDEDLLPYMRWVKRVAGVIPEALDAEGTFVATNNVVSQSVPHLHFHVVPRTRRDGLKGFFWPRRGYTDDAHRIAVAARLRFALGPPA